MGEFRNNPAIFDRLNYTKSLDKSNGVCSLQHLVAGDGDKMTTTQLYAFRREFMLRKVAKFLVFFSIPALTFYYKRNFALGAASFLASSYLADKIYSSCLFNSNDKFTKDFIKKSKLIYIYKIGLANGYISNEGLRNGKVKNFTRRELIEHFRYR